MWNYDFAILSRFRERHSARGSAVNVFLTTSLTLFLTLCASVVLGSTTPEYNMRDKSPTLTALTNATVYLSPGKSIEKATIVFEDGVIRSVGANVTAPAGARVIDLDGKTVYPGFIEVFSEYGLKKPEKKRGGGNNAPVFTSDRKGGAAWNGAIHAELNWADEFEPSKKSAEELIEIGFTVAQSARQDGIFRGNAFVASLGEGLPNDLLLSKSSGPWMSFDKGTSKQGYPGSMMGSIALIRQTFLDAGWYEKAHAAYQSNPEQEKPEYNVALEALRGANAQTYLFETGDELTLLRADRVAKEFGFNFTHIGSNYEYSRLNEIKATGATLVLPVNYPKAPPVGTLEDELDVSLAKLRHWETAPSNPARLAEAGVTFAFTTDGLKKKSDFWKSVRSAVKRGLPKETALAALTTVPAELAGVSHLTGAIAKGQLANLVVTDGDIFEKKTKILSVWVSGAETEVEEEPPLDYRGTYSLSLGDNSYTLRLKGEPEKVTGELVIGEATEDSTEVAKKLKGAAVEDDKLSFKVSLDTLGFDGSLRFSVRRDGDELLGKCATPQGDILTWSGSLTEKYDPDAEKKKKDKKKNDDSDTKSDDSGSDGDDQAAEDEAGTDKEDGAEEEDEETFVARLTYPNMAYGFSELPKTGFALVKNATLWTCDEQGNLENGDMLIKDGKIVKIGSNLDTPSGAQVIDATGKHVTPGIIDEHSHIAISRGVNECTESITAEVRIGDVVNSDDISIYRQLSGGVTAARLLHGSCNPIGGQAQAIKLRWGSTPEEMKFRAAPPSIKCALGENVVRRTWGDNYNNRYPVTRMGVETIMKDGFRAALENAADWEKFNKLSSSARARTVPPRRDLEFEALQDIAGSKMFITCHSYVQTEILMLMRLAEEFGFHIQTFTHILEGYKVADEMAAHGAGGSTFSDWWAYKFEVYDAIPYNATLMTNKGVVTAINSDNGEMARRLNQEAAKSVMYGQMDEIEALKMVTINPAKLIKIDDRVGSLTAGKDADFVIWNGHPLSVYSSVEQTWIDGKNYFNLERDLQLREEIKKEKNALIQKALADDSGGSGKGKGKGSWGEGYKEVEREWHCDDAIDVWRDAR